MMGCIAVCHIDAMHAENTPHKLHTVVKEKQDQQPLEGTCNTPQTQTTPPTSRPTCIHLLHEWDDRVSHQRVHNSQMAELGFLYIDDQGIWFKGHQPMDYMCDSYAHMTGEPSEPDESGNNDNDDQCEGRDNCPP